MRNKITKIAAAAVIVIAGIAGIISFTTSSPAYAIEDTIEAVKNIQFLHLIMRDDQENIVDERWIEIGPDGQQQRYRQENNYMELNLLYVNDGATRFFHDRTKNEVALNGPLMQFYGGDFWNLFDEIASDLSTVVEENAEYQGQRAHHVRWSNSQMDCFIDPETLLPLAIGSYDVFYEEPPAGIFDIPAIPAGAKVVDELKFEQEVDSWVQIFSEAKTALAEGKNLEAAELLEQAVDLQPLANEAWIWLGEAYFRMGQYEKAIETYTHLIDLFEGFKIVSHETHLERGLAHQVLGEKEAARKDFGIALPYVIDGLSRITQSKTDPLREGQIITEEEQIALFVNKLREATGQNFGYDLDKITDEDKQKLIAAWEKWWREHAVDYKG